MICQNMSKCSKTEPVEFNMYIYLADHFWWKQKNIGEFVILFWKLVPKKIFCIATLLKNKNTAICTLNSAENAISRDQG